MNKTFPGIISLKIFLKKCFNWHIKTDLYPNSQTTHKTTRSNTCQIAAAHVLSWRLIQDRETERERGRQRSGSAGVSWGLTETPGSNTVPHPHPARTPTHFPSMSNVLDFTHMPNRAVLQITAACWAFSPLTADSWMKTNKSWQAEWSSHR